MKIGIITWFSGVNYGTNLQAIALQYFLRNIGHTVYIINYEANEEEINWKKIETTKMFLKKIIHCSIEYIFKFINIKYSKKIIQRNNKLTEAVALNCCLTKKIYNEQELINEFNKYEILVIGSDQIWNPRWYHRFYYADYDAVNVKRISYAPSLGVNRIIDCRKQDICRSLKKFDFISVREKQGAELLKSLTHIEPVIVVDPTLLLNIEEWNRIFPPVKQKREKYVLSMFLTDNYLHWQAAKRFAKKKGLQNIVIPYQGFSYIQNATIEASAGLQEFLDLIRNAEFVLTDSFHVTIFSLIHHRQFYTFIRFREDAYNSQNARIRHILNVSKTEKRLIPYGTKEISEKTDIDYAIVQRALDYEIEKSKHFLIKAINES